MSLLPRKSEGILEFINLTGLEKIMPTNFQEYASGPLSSEFNELFATRLFAKEIETWFQGASKSVVGIVENASNANIDESDLDTLNDIDSQFLSIQSLLEKAIWNKQDLQRKSLVTMSQFELDFISPTPGSHENICIFDWIHHYSQSRFPRVIDAEMIHLVFDLIGISTFCRCKFQLDFLLNSQYEDLSKVMSDPIGIDEIAPKKEKNYERWKRVMEYYRTSHGIDIWTSTNE
jgi:hypothetical protein